MPITHHYWLKIFQGIAVRTICYEHPDPKEHAMIVAMGLHRPRRGSADPSWVDRWPDGRVKIMRDVEEVLDTDPAVNLVQVRYNHPEATTVFGKKRPPPINGHPSIVLT